MKRVIEFKGNRKEKEAAALQATREYLGNKGFKRIDQVGAELSGQSSRKIYKMALLFCLLNGISGYYPVRVVARRMIEEARRVEKIFNNHNN